MKAKDIEHNLELLGQELAIRGILDPIRVLLVGGAYMLTQLKVRRTTDDVDVYPLDEQWQPKTGGIPLPQILQEVADEIEVRYHLPEHWFNSKIAGFLSGAAEMPDIVLWRSFGPLEVYLPPNEYILALKLLANRVKDLQDIRTLFRKLRIRTRQQAQQLIDFYISDKEVQFFCGVHLHLNDHFEVESGKMKKVQKNKEKDSISNGNKDT